MIKETFYIINLDDFPDSVLNYLLDVYEPKDSMYFRIWVEDESSDEREKELFNFLKSKNLTNDDKILVYVDW